MHDGVFRKRDLGKLDRDLVERLENPEIYDDEKVVQSLDRALAPDCQLHLVFLPENLPKDLWPKETLIERASAKRLNSFNAGVLRGLEYRDWNSASYPAALEAAKQAAWEEQVAAKHRLLEAKVNPGQTKASQSAMRRYDRAADELRTCGRTGRPVGVAARETYHRSKRLDVDAQIQGARRHAP